jgi:hypothetical protein
MRKTLILVLIVVITFCLIGALVYYIKIDSFSFAWSLNFLLMMAALSFTETLKSELNSSYYDEKQWERKGKVYEALGINFFRKILVWIGWEKLNKKANPVKKDIAALHHLHHQTKKSELGHLIIVLIVFGFNLFVAFKFGVLSSLWLLALNVLLNLYPIFLQRYNRPRIVRAINVAKLRYG